MKTDSQHLDKNRACLMNYLKCHVKKMLVSIVFFLSFLTGYTQTYNVTIQGKIEKMKPGTRIFYHWYDKDHLTADFAGENFVQSDGDNLP
ncbi:hypothetical protein [Mucilaginibacter jinjuensis]|uniref:DUF4369 domain-containing protein n=1 Tax=Mucilaginibacter jinjuensis TaxID=1176721 RepID=A0ABY7TAG0_9SPHI|nr:hypothetical protein [Mucilaginibacter jinjuensis]WCT13411.1 hypothetical protein PQO05_05615 [Mucilaginibacter jinjuensis]